MSRDAFKKKRDGRMVFYNVNVFTMYVIPRNKTRYFNRTLSVVYMRRHASYTNFEHFYTRTRRTGRHGGRRRTISIYIYCAFYLSPLVYFSIIILILFVLDRAMKNIGSKVGEIRLVLMLYMS